MGITFSGIASTTFVMTFITCLLMTCMTETASVCNTSVKLKINEVGLCINGTVKKWECPSCQNGLGHSVECGRVYDEGTRIECVPCTAGTYSDTYDTSQCKKCQKCQKNEIQSGQCTSQKDNITCTCKPGFYRDLHARDCKPCSWCCGDKSNERMPECNVLQIPLEKQCSLQIMKSCAPTTSAPSTTASSSTSSSTTGTLSSPFSAAITTIEKTTMTKTDEAKKASNSSLPTKIINLKETSNNPSPEGKSWHEVLAIFLIVASCALSICLVLLLYRYLRNRVNAIRRLPRCHRDNTSDGYEHEEEHVHLNPGNATAWYHVESEEPNGIEPSLSQANRMRLPTRLDDGQLSFISEKLGTKMEDLEHGIIQTICIMLNVPVNGKDYKNLDSFCELSCYEIRNLDIGTMANPMEHIFQKMVSLSKTLESFLKELYRISRGDVVQKLYEIARVRSGEE